MPPCFRWRLSAPMLTEPSWNTLAASAPSTCAWANTAPKWSNAPAPPEAISGPDPCQTWHRDSTSRNSLCSNSGRPSVRLRFAVGPPILLTLITRRSGLAAVALEASLRRRGARRRAREERSRARADVVKAWRARAATTQFAEYSTWRRHVRSGQKSRPVSVSLTGLLAVPAAAASGRGGRHRGRLPQGAGAQDQLGRGAAPDAHGRAADRRQRGRVAASVGPRRPVAGAVRARSPRSSAASARRRSPAASRRRRRRTRGLRPPAPLDRR